MTTDKVTVSFRCKECGGTILTLPDNHTDDSIATCKKCGVKHGRWRDIKTKAIHAAKDQVITDLRNAFEEIKGFKPK